ncbi:hypothetical protein ACIP88_08085 [Streptomyces uncialis]|uniref:hypothetical protein n=1 Tax=Streptomyces uncialis TaxID=1048205 RepID=UPI00382EB1EC
MPSAAENATPVTGALLLCRGAPDAVAPVARLLREPMQAAAAGDGWTVLVPGGAPWRETGGDPVERVVTGWAGALAVGGPWPVLALWWDPGHSGFVLASGFRRPVGYEWLAGGTPVGEDEAVRTVALRLGLDPVLDLQALDVLTRGDSDADARARLIGLVAVLGRTGLVLPPGVTPGASMAALRVALRAAVGEGDADPGLWWGPVVRALCVAQVGLGVPMALWGVHRRRPALVLAGALLVTTGTVGLRARFPTPLGTPP